MAPRILIADNDSGARDQMAGWLEGAGFACSMTDTGEALAEARRHQPDVAVVGVNVPNDGGMWIVRSLRSQADNPPGIVVMSSTPNLDVATTASRLGAADCLPWPSSERSIVEAVKRAAEWRTALAAVFQHESRLHQEADTGRDRLKATMAGVEPDIAQTVLLALLESRSPATYDHVNRVARSSAALARSMRLAPAEIRDVRTAALLHDIGKIALPPRLMADSGPLSNEEIGCLRRHVSIAAEVLSQVSSLAAVAPLVAATHERYDGSGYPAGLTGADIPLGARIIAVADVYDVLTTPRPHHDAVCHDEANAELVRSAGSRLDPDVVRFWMQMLEMLRCS
ncbi:MAG TPA: HD domain-containing phosphohydrolase [Vicinamibacterales bacterium]